MSHAQAHQPLSEDDYLRQETGAEIKHELVSGEAYAVAGASERHNRIALNIVYHLRTITRGKACRAFMADMKLRIAASSTFYYPDVMLVCNPADDHPIYKQVPCLIAEVLSPATANVDMREKVASVSHIAQPALLPAGRFRTAMDACVFSQGGGRLVRAGALARRHPGCAM